MREEKGDITVQVDRYTRVCLTLIVVLLTALIAGLWAEVRQPVGTASAAEAPQWNSQAQRDELISVQKETNARLAEIIRILTSGEVRVQVTGGGAAGAVPQGGTDATPAPSNPQP
jgi:hypothetical protein